MRIRYKEVIKKTAFKIYQKNGPIYNILNENFMGGVFILILGLAS
jgi:hypothetical protein